MPCQGDASGVPSLGDLSAAVHVLRTDTPVLLLGLIQACFDAAMFCFVMLWVPAIKVASAASGGSSDLPFGLLFACLMVSIMIGSSAYGLLKSAGVRTEDAAWVRSDCAVVMRGMSWRVSRSRSC